MAKKTVNIKQTSTDKVEVLATGKLVLSEDNALTLDTPDYGVVDINKIATEMNLFNQIVEVRLVLKDEEISDIDYLELA